MKKMAFNKLLTDGNILVIGVEEGLIQAQPCPYGHT
jgi:hypothetical protein